MQERFSILLTTVQKVIKNPLEVLENIFGFTEFRPPQRKIINSILDKKDTLALLPTGYGKSLCFQIPALCLPGYTLVISPLIALMEDQVFHLREKNISAIGLHSAQTVPTKTFLSLFARQHYRFIYISPEKLLSPFYKKLFQKNPPRFIAVDEAHCFSLWGHNFRPEYRKLPSFFSSIYPQPHLALFTATASSKVIQDISRSFKIKKNNIYAGSFFRKNLFLSLKNFNLRSQRFLYICYLVFHKYRNQNGIIYCITRKEVEMLAQALKKHNFQQQLKIDYFHAGRSQKEKKIIQEKFIHNKIKLLITTNAFGMGIDKSNIRFVIHAQMPSCMEHYVQEIGRAGRDRKLSFCELLVHPADTIIHKNLSNDTKSLKKIISYTEKKYCHHKKILSFFGEKLSDNFSCNACEYCSLSKDFFISKMKIKQKKLLSTETFINQQKLIFSYKKHPEFFPKYTAVGTGYQMC